MLKSDILLKPIHINITSYIQRFCHPLSKEFQHKHHTIKTLFDGIVTLFLTNAFILLIF